jgi:hypothetical protein
MCADLYTYKSNFDPILLPGEGALIKTQQGDYKIECVAVGPLPERVYDFGALVATTWDTDNEWNGLELSDNEFAQYRMRLLTDATLRLNNLGSTRQWRTAKADFYLYEWPVDTVLQEFAWKASEFFVWEHDTPRFDFYSDIATAKCLVSFSGYRIRAKKMPAANIYAKTIWVSGWPDAH